MSYAEVAFNFDDGFEFFGGTVNVKYLSAIFCGDDSFDTDQGYQGKMQYLFTMLGDEANHGTEMDSKFDTDPRSHPEVYGMTVIGGGASGAGHGGLMRLREGTGGKFGNIVLAHGAHAANGGNNKKDSFAVKQTDCSSEAFQTSMTSFPSGEDYLAFSGNTVVHETGADGDTNGGLTSLSGSCASRPFTFKSSTSSPFQQVDRAKLDYKTINAGSLDPRPTGMACSNTDNPKTADAWFDSTPQCKGAFPSTSGEYWLEGWSWLDCKGLLKPSGASNICTQNVDITPFKTVTDTTDFGGDYRVLGGDVTTLSLEKKYQYLLTSQVFVSGTLTVEAGTTIYGLPKPSMYDSSLGATVGAAPAVIVEKGGKINAAGTPTAPITMTSILSEEALYSTATEVGARPRRRPRRRRPRCRRRRRRHLHHLHATSSTSMPPAPQMTDSNSLSGTIALGKRGKWGGLILLGDAPSSNYKQKSIEGIDSTKGGYGGIDPNHNGGVLTYVRVWHGGAVVGADNEINGITFGAVGSGTTVHHCEVAYNADDGFE